jgi:hypothetical protein
MLLRSIVFLASLPPFAKCQTYVLIQLCKHLLWYCVGSNQSSMTLTLESCASTLAIIHYNFETRFRSVCICERRHRLSLSSYQDFFHLNSINMRFEALYLQPEAAATLLSHLELQQRSYEKKQGKKGLIAAFEIMRAARLQAMSLFPQPSCGEQSSTLP